VQTCPPCQAQAANAVLAPPRGHMPALTAAGATRSVGIGQPHYPGDRSGRQAAGRKLPSRNRPRSSPSTASGWRGLRGQSAGRGGAAVRAGMSAKLEM
jgi:hypothetical protein